MVSIISNNASAIAQANLKKANDDAAAAIFRLSSGNRIDRPATDPAGLAIGALIKAQLAVFTAASTNTAQASSLLGIAGGALSQVSDLLSRQQELATQATNGTLSASDRGYLDLEFQQLSSEINQIATQTNFNGIKLIDGSLYAPAVIATKANANSIDTSGTLAFNGSTITNGDTTTINGVTFTWKTTPTSAPTDIQINNGSGTTQAQALYTAIQNTILTTNTTYQDQKNLLSQLDFQQSTNTITIISKSAGTIFNSGGTNQIGITGAFVNSGPTVNSTSIQAATVYLSAGGTAGSNGDLYAGTFSTGTNAYTGTATTITQGTIGDNILTAINTTASSVGAGGGYATGVNTSGISNNPAFVGTINGFQATYVANDYMNISIQVGNYTYTANNVKSTPGIAGNTTIYRFSSIQDGGGYFDLQFNTGTLSSLTTPITDQNGANIFAQRLNAAFSGLQFFQNRTISSYNAIGTIFSAGTSTSIGSLAGTSFKLINNNFTNLNISNVSVTAPVAPGANGTIQFTINGNTFTSGFNATGSPQALGSSIANGTTVGFVNTSDPRQILTFTNNSGGSIDFSTIANAQGVQSALTTAFGINKGATALTFQVGSSPSDTINVQLQGAQTSNLYLDNNGNTVTNLTINGATTANAVYAGTILTTALSNISSQLATVGGYQSRFDFAASAIDISRENLQAASSTLLDTDIENESANLAAATIRLKAGVAALVHANQIPHSLLKLLD